MTKKTYMQPALNVVEIHHSDILTISEVNSGYYYDTEWQDIFDGGYDKNGGNQQNAW